MTKISQLSSDTAPTLDDYMVTVDLASGQSKRITLSALMSLLMKTNQINQPYKFEVYRLAAYSVPVATLIMDTKVFDTGNNYSLTTGNFTAPESGYYFFYGQVAGTPASGQYFWANLNKNGTEARRGNRVNGNGGLDYAMVFGQWFLNAGDTMSIGAASGASSTGESSQAITFFGGFMVSKT